MRDPKLLLQADHGAPVLAEDGRSVNILNAELP